MKRMLVSGAALVLLVGAAGCDPLQSGALDKMLLTSQGIDSVALDEQVQEQQQIRARDGSCLGEGNQNRYQFQNGGACLGGGNGQCGGEQLRLRDGSCGSGGPLGDGQGGGTQLRLRDGSCQQ
ncbi:MAG: hypothetical protein AB1716_20110 [Planctomycetota bacterium]